MRNGHQEYKMARGTNLLRGNFQVENLLPFALNIAKLYHGLAITCTLQLAQNAQVLISNMEFGNLPIVKGL